MDIQIKDQKYDSEIKRFMANEDNLNSALDEAHNKINNLQKEIKMLRANEEIMIETTKKEIESALSNLNEKLNETQQQLSQKEEKVIKIHIILNIIL